MASINDVGVPGMPLNNPPLTEWQKAVRDRFNTDDAWTTFTPGASGWTPQSHSCRYQVTPSKRVTLQCQVTIQTLTSSPLIGLPAAIAGYGSPQPVQFLMTDSGTAYYEGVAFVMGSWIDLWAPAAAGGALRAITSTVPFTWAPGDIWHITGLYLAA